jgi:hypothetical protein
MLLCYIKYRIQTLQLLYSFSVFPFVVQIGYQLNVDSTYECNLEECFNGSLPADNHIEGTVSSQMKMLPNGNGSVI